MTSSRAIGPAARRGMAAAILASVLAAPLAAQVTPDAGPVVVSPRPETTWLHFDTLDVSLTLEWRRDADRRDPEVGDTVRDREDRFQEILELHTTGFIWHPNLVQLDLRGELRVVQRRLDFGSAGMVENVDESLLDYHASALLLREQFMPIRLYTFRTQNDVDRQFGGSLDSTLEEDGVEIDIRSDRAPTSIQIFRRRQEQSDQLGNQEFRIEQKTIQADGRIEIDDRQSIWWDAAYDDIDEGGDLRLTRSVVRRELNATYRRDLVRLPGDASEPPRIPRSSYYRAQIRLYEETGDFDYRQLRLDQRLRIEHSNALATWLDALVERIDRFADEQHRQEVSWTARHQLFDSLITIGEVGYRRLRVPSADFRSSEVYGDLALDYTKIVRPGTFYGGLTVSASDLDETDRGQPFFFVDRPFVFGPDDLIVISEQSIDAGSIVVTDITGLIVYTEGADYTLLGLPDRVEIRRVLGGDIGPGEAVLVDYEIGPEPGGRTRTHGLGVSLEYRFREGPMRGLGLYTRMFWQSEDRTSNLAGLMLDERDFRDLIYGAEYRFWRMYLKAEQQRRRGGLSPFDSTRFEARYVDRFAPGSSLQLRALYQEIDRLDADIHTRTTTLSAHWSQRLSRRLRTDLSLVWTDLDNSLGNDVQAFEQEFRLRWIYGQTELYARVRNTFRDTVSDDTTFQTFQIGLQRDF